MKRMLGLVSLLGVIGALFTSRAQELPAAITLPAPQTSGGKPLLQALQERKSTRDLAPTPLPLPLLADLLWAADGINRPEIAHRTAPSAMNSQELDIYVATGDGTFVYDAKANRLTPIAAGDIRARTGTQEFVKIAPVALIFVADFSRMVKAKSDADRERYAAIDTGYVSQNIYLFCASAGLATVVHELDRTGLRDALHLKPDQRIMLAQAVGYPKPAAAK